MRYDAGLYVSVKETSVCILDETGRVCLERKVASDPADLALVLQDPRWSLYRVGLVFEAATVLLTRVRTWSWLKA